MVILFTESTYKLLFPELKPLYPLLSSDGLISLATSLSNQLKSKLEVKELINNTVTGSPSGMNLPFPLASKPVMIIWLVTPLLLPALDYKELKPQHYTYPSNSGFAVTLVFHLPLIALQYHEVKIELEFRPKAECYVSTGGSLNSCGVSVNGSLDAFCVPSLEYASLFIDYIYLDTDERRRFAQTSHEYLIEQLQFTGDESTVNTNVKVKLNLNHPVKELIWVTQRDDVVKLGYNQWNNYTDDFDADSGYYALNSQGLPDASQLVFSNVEDTTNVFPFVGTNALDADYLQYLKDAGLNTGAGGIVDNGVTTSQVRPISLPAGPGPNANNLAPTDFGAITTAGDYSDHAGFGPVNAGRRNPVVRAKLQLNGHDRFQERLGSYFNLVQPYQHHTNIPPTGINVYSFAFKTRRTSTIRHM